MTKEEKISYVDIALRMSGLQFDLKSIDKIIRIIDIVDKKKGETNIEDIVKMLSDIKKEQS